MRLTARGQGLLAGIKLSRSLNTDLSDLLGRTIVSVACLRFRTLLGVLAQARVPNSINSVFHGPAQEKGYRRKDESGASLLTTRSEAIALSVSRLIWTASENNVQ